MVAASRGPNIMTGPSTSFSGRYRAILLAELGLLLKVLPTYPAGRQVGRS